MLPFSKNTETPATPAPIPRSLPQAGATPREVPAAYIGEGVTIAGILQVPGAVVVEGEFTGDITAQEVTIGKNGKVVGSIQSPTVNVHGRAEQRVSADRLIVHASGLIVGQVEYAEIEIVRGGLIDGAIRQRGASDPDGAPT